MTAEPRDRTDWRAVWNLIQPYWRSEEKWRAWGLLAAVIALALGMVYLNVLFNTWSRDSFNALETKNYQAFKEQLWRFSYLAFIYITVAIYRVYLRQALEMRWRSWLTQQYMSEWLAHQAYYRIEQTRSADNPDQRIADDLSFLTTGTVMLSLEFLTSVVTLVSFIGILWTVSGPLAFAIGSKEFVIPAYMVWFAIAYAVVGSVAVLWVGKPLVQQNFLQQRFEANFRFGLIRIRENAEAVALYRGEAAEQAQLTGRFEQIRQNWWAIMRTTKQLNVVSTFYAQFAIIFPMLVAAPRYFSNQITLGVYTQIGDAFGQVQDALSWFVNAFGKLAEWKASVNRLAGFHAAISAARSHASGITVIRNNVGAILIDDMQLNLPNGIALTHALTADIRQGQRILVTGPSGSGKSTLFRAVAGIWPYGTGNIEVPNETRLLFLPQKSYLPVGSLRAALVYPAGEAVYKDRAIEHYLEACQLAHLKGRLDDIDNWSQRLSPGEHQRLAFVRVLLTRPDVLFLDEATSALDPAAESMMYELVLRELPEAALVSIAHREAVAKYHQLRWQFVAEKSANDETADETALPRYTIQRSR
jgi:vitamin B12/bleomycin/antimicrobial peptide transport system ATP-binding/permease protein